MDARRGRHEHLTPDLARQVGPKAVEAYLRGTGQLGPKAERELVARRVDGLKRDLEDLAHLDGRVCL